MKSCHVSIILCLCSFFVSAQTACSIVAWWSFDEGAGNQTTELVTSSQFNIHNNYDHPEYIPGARDVALRLDGFSTWVQGNFSFPADQRSLSISTWYATEAYPTETAAIINQQGDNKGFGVELTKYGILTFVIRADGQTYQVQLNNPLPKYQWNHILAIADLDQRILRLVLNDTIESAFLLPTLESFDWSDSELKIGIHNQTNIFAGLWPTGVLNGVIDEVQIFGCALSQQEIDTLYSNNMPSLDPDLAIPETRHANDNHRPRFHAMPPTSWTNEPYGLIFHKGFYHMFYQKNPNGPYHSHMHWGHIRSKDLVTWEDMPIALAPQPGWDQHGIWSGHVVKDENENVFAFYTGVDGVKAGIGIAYPDDDLQTWTKDISNPLIPNPPSTYNHMDFRDPFVWKHSDQWFMIVGSGIHQVGGILMTYSSTDLLNWQVAAPLFNDTYENSGRFWEMPAFVKINDTKYILFVNTVPWDGAPAETIYWVGEWSGSRFTPDHTKPKKFDLINGPLLAPSISTDEAGRIIAIGIIPETRSSEAQNAAGWAHTYSLPRQLRLMNDGNLAQIPHPNLCRLREENIHIDNRQISSGSQFNTPEITGNQVELNVEVNADSAAIFSIQLSKNEDGSELTTIDFNLAENKIILDRSKSSLSNVAKDVREAKYTFDHNENVIIKIFIDHSVLEVFVDNTVTFSSRIYPSKINSDKIDVVVSNGAIEIVSLDAWTLKDMRVSENVLVCEPDPGSLPNALRTEIDGPVLGIDNEKASTGFQLFPNPARTNIQIIHSGNLENGEFDISLFTTNGQIVASFDDVKSNQRLDIHQLAPGMYYAEVRSKGVKKVIRFAVMP
jgi:beta-fructofuranosidase